MEISKFEDNKEIKNCILITILKDLLKLWHPFIPFITETIWKEVWGKDLLMIEKWPTVGKYNFLISLGEKNNTFDLIKNIIISIRNAKIENKIDPKKKIKVIIDTKNTNTSITDLVTEQKDLIMKLRTGIGELEIKNDGKKVENSIHRTVAGINIYIPTEGLIDVAKEKVKAEKELAVLEKYIAELEGRLKNKGFVEKAPADVVSQQKESLGKAKAKFAEIKKHLKELE